MARGHALLTGALGGLGTAIAETLARSGIPVIACDRRLDDSDAWLAALPADLRERIKFEPLNVAREDEIVDLADRLRFAGIDIAYLINNAGIQGNAAPWALESRIWDIVLRVNVNATFYLTRTFSKSMADRGFGRIVNLASLYAYHPGPGQSPYAAAKAAITGYTRSTALDLAPHGVTVNAIAPGLIWHKRLEGVLPEAEYQDMLKRTPVGRMGKPEEIAATVAFLISEDAGFITGQTIHVNGGAYLPG
jgi:acetoacetyl-CoA reductase